MVKHQTTSLNTTFAALADPTRRAILRRLEQGPATVTQLAQPFNVSLPAISKHLRVLEEAGLLSRRREGRTHYCKLNAAPLKEATSWLVRYEQFWEGQLEALDHFLSDWNAEDSP